MQRAFLIALITGPVGGLLGTFVTLRRLSFFSDAISHSAMTGVALGFSLNIAREVNSPSMQGVLLVFCVLMALFMAWLFEKTTLHTDTVIAFSFTGSVALGVVVLSRMDSGARILHSALFGDILASSPADLWLVLGLAVATLVFLFLNMRALTLSVVQENLARLQGFNMRRINYLFVALIALVVAVLLRQMGALLVSGLLVIPAAGARLVAGSFRAMLLLSAAFGTIGGGVGVFSSYHLDTPTGPTIVLALVAVLSICLAWSWVFKEHTLPWNAGGDLEKR
jgi:ABC-type Mn2+/Zn2+ transport system permease subunit